MKNMVKVDRVPKHVQVTLSDKTGIVMWSPSSTGAMREVILLSLNGRHRLQITIHGHAVPATRKHPEQHQKKAFLSSSSVTASANKVNRQPLMPTSSSNGVSDNEQESPFSCQPRRLNLDKACDLKENETFRTLPIQSLSSTFHDLESRLQAVLKSRDTGVEDLEEETVASTVDSQLGGGRKSLSAPASPVRRGRAEARIAEDSR